MNSTFSFKWCVCACMEDSPERTCMCCFVTYTVCVCVDRCVCACMEDSPERTCMCCFVMYTVCVWAGVYRLRQWAVLFDACVELDRHAWVALIATWEHAGNTKHSVVLALNHVRRQSLVEYNDICNIIYTTVQRIWSRHDFERSLLLSQMLHLFD